MEDNGIFSTHGLWRPSIFTVNSIPEDTIFEGLQLNELSGLASKQPIDNLFEGLLDGFDLPPLEDIPAHADLERYDVLRDLSAKSLANLPAARKVLARCAVCLDIACGGEVGRCVSTW